jgi:hypothetical protein
MKSIKGLLLACGLAGALLVGVGTSAKALGYGRQYYSSWSYYPTRSYYYTTYYYKPYVSYASYDYHYCVYYPSYPQYVYYYNPHKRVYWGRYDLNAKGYSLLAEKDRKEKLADIPNEAFPKPAGMPVIPDAEDKVTISEPPAPPATTPGGGQ